MKTIAKTLIGFAAASVAAVSVLTVSALAAANGAENAGAELQSANSTWHKEIETVNPGSYANTFIGPTYYEVSVDGGYAKGSAKTSITAYSGYKSNYKRASLYVKTYDNQIISDFTKESDCNDATVSASASYNTDSYPKYIQYFGYIYPSTSNQPPYLQNSVVSVYTSGNEPFSENEEMTE